MSNVEIILVKQLASCLVMPIFVIGPDGDIVYCNESSEELFGFRFDETGQMKLDQWRQLLAAGDGAGPRRERERPIMLSVLEHGEPTHGRLSIPTASGATRQIEGTAVPLIALDGSNLGVLGFFWDAERSALRDVEESLAAAGTRQHAVETILTRRLASRLALPIFLEGPDGQLLYFNEAAAPILGSHYDKLVAMPREELYRAFQPKHEDGRPIAREDHPLAVARRQREPVHDRLRICGFDGVERLIAATAIPLVGQSGRMLGALGVFWETPSVSGETPSVSGETPSVSGETPS